MKNKIRNFIFILLVMGITALCGCSEPEASVSLFAMDTYMTLKAYGKNAQQALDKAEEEIVMLDGLLSTGDPDSEVSQINNTGKNEGSELSETVNYLMKRSLEAYEMTDGAFNPLIYPVMQAWGFTDENYQVPEEELLTGLHELTDISMMEYDGENGVLSFLLDGMKIDFGGIAKGYTSERVIEILKENGVNSAVVSLGGNVQTLGKKPDGSLWKVAVRDPADASKYIGVLSVADKAVITSGGYERNFEKDGVVYHHIIDPETFYPADSGIVSSTVVSDDATLADALSTAVFVMGTEKASRLWKAGQGKFEFIVLTDDGQLFVTEGIKDSFSADGYKVNVIS